MPSARNAAVAARFSSRAGEYERHATLQRAVADELAKLLPALRSPRVLEIGCGTGLFSRHLLSKYRDGRMMLTDLAPDMLLRCRSALGPATSRLSFNLMDGEEPDAPGPFDLIASSMTLQWFADPKRALKRWRHLLSEDGALLYATLGPDSFAEWRAALDEAGLESGLVETPVLPGVLHEETRTMAEGAYGFLSRLQRLGASVPILGYRPSSPGALRKAMRIFDRAHNGRVTWRIVYGRLTA